MPVPPRGNPYRPAVLAVRLMRLIGIVLLIVGCGCGVTQYWSMSGLQTRNIVLPVVLTASWVVPGIGLLWSSVSVRRYRFAGVVVGILLGVWVTLNLLLILAGATLSIYAVWRDQVEPIDPYLIMFVGSSFFLLIATIAMIWHLGWSFGSIHAAEQWHAERADDAERAALAPPGSDDWPAITD